MSTTLDGNPFKPGAGHSPPYLAGRSQEIALFAEHLRQEAVTKNVILTGLRGVGKTVLMDDEYRPTAQKADWAWVGSDFSESSFLSEQNLCLRLLTDLSVYSSGLSIERASEHSFGFLKPGVESQSFDFEFLWGVFQATPGLTSDKLKAVLLMVWEAAKARGVNGIVLAYDEAQVVSDRQEKDQYPLAVLLETFQSIQRKGAKYLLLLTGLPTLFPRLVESRTYAERMFTVQEISRLSADESRKAITVPLTGSKWQFAEESLHLIIQTADGYPYFIQFICRQALDYLRANPESKSVPIDPIVRQLDADFFSGRWETLTDRQRDLLFCIAKLSNADGEYAINDIAEASKNTSGIKPFSPNDISQMMPRLIEKGVIYKNRYSKYAFAVPLFSHFIARRDNALERQQEFNFEST